MKHTLRFVIAGIFLAGVIFGIWALFLNPDKRITINERLSAVNSLDEDYEIENLLDKVEVIYTTGINGNELSENSKMVLDKVYSVHEISPPNLLLPGAGPNYYSGYKYYYTKLNEAYNYYAVYANAIKSISSRDLGKLKSQIKEYKNNLSNLADKLKAVLSFVETYAEDNGNSAVFGNFENYCDSINNAYYYTLGSYANLCKTVRDICIKYVYGESYLYSTSSIVNDCVIYQAIATFDNDEYSEVIEILDLEIFCILLDKFNVSGNIFDDSKVSEMDYINGYTMMQKVHSAKLGEYFELTRENKYLLKVASEGSFDDIATNLYSIFSDCNDDITPLNQLLFYVVDNIKNYLMK